MTIANYVGAGIVGLALMTGCRRGAPQSSEYNFNCGKTNDSKTVCAEFNEGKVTSFRWVEHPVTGNCFYAVGHENECKGYGGKSYPMSPSLEKAANDFFRGQRELSFGIDKVLYDAHTKK